MTRPTTDRGTTGEGNPAESVGADSGQQGGAPRSGSGASSPHIWVATTYFGEGFPYSVVNSLAEVLFKERGASLETIGLTALFHLPWNIKFLWGPFLDVFATKRAWLVWTEVIISAVLVGLAATTSMGASLTIASIFFVVLAFLSATHDIAIDGYYLEGLDKEGQSKFVGYRASAYKVAMWVVASPPLIMLGAGWSWGPIFLSAAGVMGLLLAYHALFLPRVERPGRPIRELLHRPKPRTLTIGAGIALGILGVRAAVASSPAQALWASLVAAVPSVSKLSSADWVALALLAALLVLMASLGRIKRRITQSDSFYAAAFVDFLSQRHVGRILAFVILFRAGESFLLKMRYPFLREMGMTPEQFGIAAGTVGLGAAFVATLVGGYLISRGGLERWIWPMVMAQNGLHLVYMGMAWHHEHVEGLARAAQLPAGAQVTGRGLTWSLEAFGHAMNLEIFTDAGHLGFVPLTAGVTLEAFGYGLGTAVFMVYIMRCCRPAYKAAHMAILTALMSVAFTLAGVLSGFMAAGLGFTLYFAFTFVVTIPAMVLQLFVPYLDGTSAADDVPA